VPLGWSDSPAAERHGDIDTLDPLRFETVPLSRSEIDYPAIREMHEASSLPTPDAVAAWRTGACPRPAEIVRDAVPLQPLDAEDVPGDAIDRVIHRRSSTRTFGRTALSYGSFSTILDRATRGVPMDCLGPPGTMLNEIYVIANAVEGLMPGTYVYRRDELALAPLSQGDFRRDAAHLGLGQALPGDASADVFSLVNLGPVLERYGDRGYRVAELEAGIIGGKLYLAAYAQRLGATGLTFFDDDVTEFFSPHASGKSVMFLVALGVSARRAPR
jgi:hypothetical protein